MGTSLELPRLVRYLDENGQTRYELAPGGSFDDALGPVQMRAVHHGLIFYFGTVDWIEARRQEQPGLW